MIFTRISIILLTCLLATLRLQAQTDSAPPPLARHERVRDTGAIPAAPPLQRRDSVSTAQHRRDSLRRDSIRRARRDSLRRLRRDSAFKAAGDTAAAPVKAIRSDYPPQNPVHPFVPATDKGPAALQFWQKTLSENRYLRFTGQPVAETFEVHRSNGKDSMFYLILAILYYFALIRVFFEKYFNNLLTLFFRVSLRQQQIREQVLQTPLPSLMLNILFVISAGLYACFLLHYSRVGADIRFWVLYMDCMALLAAIYLVKFLVLKFIGWVFSISRATDTYIFVVFLVNKMMGIMLLPFLIVVIFSGQQWREVFITISLAMIFVLWGYRILASFRPVRNEIKLTPFYFFLYLCAFEIAPLLLIYKVLLTYLEKVY
ncbi:MAG TPA: DUF4271 domain-containing protein [Puia sp.]|nr:DUF4271 domain-containing protein [Puia sp.]